MKLVIYPRLSTNSKRAMRRKQKQWGWKYVYKPRPKLINRLCQELGWTEDEVREQIEKEREFILAYVPYFLR